MGLEGERCQNARSRESRGSSSCGKAQSAAASSSEIHKAPSCRKKEYVKAACDQLIGIVDKYDLPCGTSSGRSNPTSEDVSYFKFPKFKKSQADFLNDLNKFIERELELRYWVKDKEALDDEGEQVRVDIKLKIFREALHVVQENVPSYRGILGRVKEAYDEAICIRDKRLRELEVMGTALLKLQKDVESQKAAIWEDSMERVVSVLREKLELIGMIDSVRNDRNEMKEAVVALSKELEASHSRLMEEIDARRLVSYECTQLNDQVEILRNKARAVVQKPEKAVDSDEANDPVVLKMALDKCRAALGKAQAKVTYMETVYDTVCPQRDFDALQGRYSELEKSKLKLLGQVGALEKQIQGLERKIEEVNVEKLQFLHRLQDMQATGTPRVDWKLCAQFVPGGLEAWEALTIGKSSREKLSLLVEQLTKPQDFGEAYFTGRGKEADIPPYLRYEGQIYNRRYTLRDVRIIIHDIWRTKLKAKNQEAMSLYLTEYAEGCFPVSRLRAELTYSLVEGCRRYLHDPQVNLFYDILVGECQEEVYLAQHEEMEVIKEEAKSKLSALRSKMYLTGAAFCEMLRQTFPLKSETEVMALLEAASTELGISIGQDLSMGKLFEEAEEGLEQRNFGREMGEQFRAARKKFAEEVVQSVAELMAESNVRDVTVGIVREAFAAIGSDLEEGHLRWMFAVPPEGALERAPHITAAVLATRLEQGNIRRRPLPPPQPNLLS